MLCTSSGKFFTLEASKLPGGRGAGEPVRLLADVDAADALVALFAYKSDSKLLVASTDGDGFVVAAVDCLANTRKGKQVLNLSLIHISEPTRQAEISYAVFCLKK